MRRERRGRAWRRLKQIIDTVLLAMLLSTAALWTVVVADEADEKWSENRAISDTRMLIDMSGSMRYNDPDNLRVPAVHMLIDLVPDGARAGVWTFAREVNMLVPGREVDDAWRELASREVRSIHSLGLFTDIEQVMRRSTWDWTRPDPAYKRTMILLTDGVIDISRDPEKNRLSRERVLKEILPRLKKADVAINTIALSNEADQSLLRQLSGASGGWYSKVDDVRQLERVFLRMYEEAVRPDTLPLRNNHFNVDRSVNEMTVLSFHANSTSPSTILAPNGEIVHWRDHPQNVRWHREEGYDLVTIKQPRSGNWEVVGEVDPDNRVTVVTDISLETSPVPKALLVGDHVDFHVRLTQEGRVIDSREFLAILDIKLIAGKNEKKWQQWDFKDDGRGADRVAGDGTFSLRVSKWPRTGVQDLTLVVDGITFRREKRYLAHVYDSPVSIAFKAKPGTKKEQYLLSVTPHPALVDLEKSPVVSAFISNRDSLRKKYKVAKSGDGVWSMVVAAAPEQGRRSLQVYVKGIRPDGRRISYRSKRIGFGKAIVRVKSGEKTAGADQATDTGVENGSAADASGSPNWIMVILQVLIVNGLLIGMAWFGYRKYVRSRRQAFAKLDGALSDDSDG
ncbi:MAG: VWA domain-containing protein [Gammaproteobacteria bacterium]|nr:VWA domain-containing protein [Gammaproteobacteria bacterium]